MKESAKLGFERAIVAVGPKFKAPSIAAMEIGHLRELVEFLEADDRPAALRPVRAPG